MRALLSIILTILILLGISKSVLLSPLLGAALIMTAGIVLTATIVGSFAPRTLVCGAAAALAHSLVFTLSPILAGGLFLSICFVPRALRVKGGRPWMVVHLVLALLGGLGAFWVVTSYGFVIAQSVEIRIVAFVVAGLLAAAPWIIAAKDSVTAELDSLANSNSGTARWRMERAAKLRRKMNALRSSAPRSEMKRIDLAFLAVCRLGRTRIGANETQGRQLDDAIGEHLVALEQTHRAIVARTVAVASSQREAADDLRQGNLQIEAEAEAFAGFDLPTEGAHDVR